MFLTIKTTDERAVIRFSAIFTSVSFAKLFLFILFLFLLLCSNHVVVYWDSFLRCSLGIYCCSCWRFRGLFVSSFHSTVFGFPSAKSTGGIRANEKTTPKSYGNVWPCTMLLALSHFVLGFRSTLFCIAFQSVRSSAILFVFSFG